MNEKEDSSYESRVSWPSWRRVGPRRGWTKKFIYIIPAAAHKDLGVTGNSVDHVAILVVKPRSYSVKPI